LNKSYSYNNSTKWNIRERFSHIKIILTLIRFILL
jgi:hypothetical protein